MKKKKNQKRKKRNWEKKRAKTLQEQVEEEEDDDENEKISFKIGDEVTLIEPGKNLEVRYAVARGEIVNYTNLNEEKTTFKVHGDEYTVKDFVKVHIKFVHKRKKNTMFYKNLEFLIDLLESFVAWEKKAMMLYVKKKEDLKKM